MENSKYEFFVTKKLFLKSICPPQNKTEVIYITPALWWAMRDLNPRPPQCRCDALPTAPTAHTIRAKFSMC